RVLAILTRNRNLAVRLGEKRNMQRLFVMVKQLAGKTSEKLQSSVMLVLRHIVEDEATVRQIMQTEIKYFFTNRQQRHHDTSSYLKVKRMNKARKIRNVSSRQLNRKTRMRRSQNMRKLNHL